MRLFAPALCAFVVSLGPRSSYAQGAAATAGIGPARQETTAPSAAPGPPGPDARARAPDGQVADPDENRKEPLWFADSVIEWVHAVTAQTVGLGASYQSGNPTYEMGLALAPRIRLGGDDSGHAFVAGRIELFREWTDSDVTTRRGETSLNDATLFGDYRIRLHRGGGYETAVTARAPILAFPTSTFSSQNGTLLGLGAGAALQQKLPLTGTPRPPSVALQTGAEYTHTFTRAVVPTNPELRRERMDPEGRTVPGDQLTGAAFPAHELRLHARGTLAVTERLAWLVDVSYRPVWKYALDDTEVCVTTGCEPLARPSDPSRYIVVTGFATEVSYDVLDELTVALGYSNVVTQPGPDGQRRNVFHSPGAQVVLTLAVHLDALYVAARGDTSGSRDVAARR